MGWFHHESDEAQAYHQVCRPLLDIVIEKRGIRLFLQVVNATEPHHHAKLSHELIAAAASYEVGD